MSLFWILFSFFVILFSYFGDESRTNNRKLSRLSKLLLLVTLSVVLSICGSPYVDHDGYRSLFYYIEKLDFGGKSIEDLFIGKSEGTISPIENGFYLLTSLIYKIGFSHVGYFFILGFITNYFIIKVFYRFKYPVISFLLYLTSNYFYQEFNLVRQMLAVSIILYSISFIENKQWKHYVFYLTIAFLIHQSAVLAIIFLPFCFIDNLGRVWNQIKWVLIPLYFISFLVALKIVNPDFSVLVMGLDFYEGYITNEDGAGIDKVNVNWIYNFLIVLCFLSYKGEQNKYVYTLFFIIGCIILNISVAAHNFGRIALFFGIIYPAFAPDMLGSRNLFKQKILSTLLLVLLTAYHARMLLGIILTGNHLVGTKIESLLLFR